MKKASDMKSETGALKKLRDGKVVVTEDERARALVKEGLLAGPQAAPGTSSKRSCPSTMTNVATNIRTNKNSKEKVVDPYLLKLLKTDEQETRKGDTTANNGTLTTGPSKLSMTTEFRMPEPPNKKLRVGASAIPIAVVPALPMDIQASNSLEKTKTTNPSTQHENDKAANLSTSQPQWDYLDTKSVLGEEVFDSLKTTVIQHQKEYLEQLFDLHRAIAVQRLLVRHSEDQKLLVKEYRKEEARAKKALQKVGIGFGTTTEWHKGLHPDSQFAALSSDAGTDPDGSGDDATGSDVAASGSGGNGKSGNGSGGGSTSQLAPNLAGRQTPIAGIQGTIGVGQQRAAPSGASNAPITPWGTAFGNIAPGMSQGATELPGGAMMYAPYGADPMMWWYQDLCSKVNVGPKAPPNCQMAQQPQISSHQGPFPAQFKWWQDPKAFMPRVNPQDEPEGAVKDTVARPEGTEVESAPPSDGNPPTKDDSMKECTKGNEMRKREGDEKEKKAYLVNPAKKRRRPRKRLPQDPVAAASSGTSGPLPHYSSDGVARPSPRSQDGVGNVAKLLLSISGKDVSADEDEPKRRLRSSRRA
jgi:hypothetical protein